MTLLSLTFPGERGTTYPMPSTVKSTAEVRLVIIMVVGITVAD